MREFLAIPFGWALSGLYNLFNEIGVGSYSYILAIVLITVCESNGELPDLNTLDKVMERLGLVIKHDLRRGDVISKYSGAQFVMMLPDAKYNDAIMITNRIIKSYYQHNRKSLLQLKYKINEIKFEEDKEIEENK